MDKKRSAAGHCISSAIRQAAAWWPTVVPIATFTGGQATSRPHLRTSQSVVRSVGSRCHMAARSGRLVQIKNRCLSAIAIVASARFRNASGTWL